MILDLLFLTVYIIAAFMIRKYVFFEPELDVKKQRIFYGITLLVVLIVRFTVGNSATSGALLVMVGINIFLARKKHRILGFLVIFPLAGIASGLFIPFEEQIPHFFFMSEQVKTIYLCGLYTVMLFLFAIFCVKGRAWRSWFDENLQNRSLTGIERWLLYICGIMLIYLVGTLDELDLSNISTSEENLMLLDVFINMRFFVVFFATVAIIGLILRENKRSFYQQKVLGMQTGMITFMADLVENRDDNTGGHIKRTARYVESITKELKRRGAYQDILTDEYIRELVIAAPLHDIGKIHVPDDVLNKPGRLTDEEFNIMKAHTTAGQDLLLHAKKELGEYGYLTMALEMAAYHHEWWNGKGYPYGISGEEIPLCARIMAVADVFDALIS
ncbi:MAG: HD domain-containing protein, partial [Lachnospiraceae bacterium]|nr:HD domain-containing protein [Lachnospiraceae bacterium]